MLILSFLLLMAFGVQHTVWGVEESGHSVSRGQVVVEAGFGRVELAESCLAVGGGCGFIPWKNRCVRVSRQVVGGVFEFGGESGFGGVSPYMRRFEVSVGFMELLFGGLAAG